MEAVLGIAAANSCRISKGKKNTVNNTWNVTCTISIACYLQRKYILYITDSYFLKAYCTLKSLNCTYTVYVCTGKMVIRNVKFLCNLTLTLQYMQKLTRRSDWSLCGGLGDFWLRRLGWRGPKFRCGGPDWRPGSAWHWLGHSAGDYNGHRGGADLRSGCGRGWYWWQTRGVGRRNLRLNWSCRCCNSWWSTNNRGDRVRIRKGIESIESIHLKDQNNSIMIL